MYIMKIGAVSTINVPKIYCCELVMKMIFLDENLIISTEMIKFCVIYPCVQIRNYVKILG